MTKAVSGFDISGPGNEELQEWFRFYASHFVGLAGLCQPLSRDGSPKGDAHCFFRSGFVISIRRTWYLATAGHIVKAIESEVHSRETDVRQFYLVDCFGLGSRSKEPIPFDYAGSYKFFRFDKDEGLDFGIIELRPYYRGLLRANGVVAISKKDWRDQNRLRFKKYFMLGLPADCIERRITKQRQGYTVHGKPVPSMVYVSEVKRPKRDWLRPYPRFIGRVSVKREPSVGDIDGMSGGPIFGFSEHAPGRHFIVAVQSSWRRREGITFACPVPVFAPLAEEHLKEVGR